MSVFTIVIPALVFVLCLLIHAALWRARFPKNRPAALFVIFVMLPLLAAGACAFFLMAGFLPDTVLSGGELFAAAMLQLAFAFAYILTYPAFEALSPSLVIILLVGSRGSISKDELSGLFSDEAIFEPRIKDLLDSGLARSAGGVLRVTGKGRVLAVFFTLMRSFIGLSKGGG